MDRVSIRDEYARLCQFFQTSEGRKKIDDLWCEALNEKQRPDGSWYRSTISLGENACGLGVDLILEKFIITPAGYDHSDAFHTLVQERYTFLHNNPGEVILEFETEKIFRGFLASVNGWEYPLLQFPGLLTEETTVVLEEFVLSREIGLPLNSLNGIFSPEFDDPVI